MSLCVIDACLSNPNSLHLTLHLNQLQHFGQNLPAELPMLAWQVEEPDTAF